MGVRFKGLPISLDRVLHNQTAGLMRGRLRERENVVVIDVPYHIPKPV